MSAKPTANDFANGFYTLFQQFVESLCTVFPDEDVLEKTKMWIKMCPNSFLIEMFHREVSTPHSELIKTSEDESQMELCNERILQMPAPTSIEHNTEFVQLMDRCKNLYCSMPLTTQKQFWKYMRNFNELANRYQMQKQQH
jgi:hypothetical protein